MWATKYRKPILTGRVAQRLIEILYETAEQYEVEIDTVECGKDHVHLLCSFPPKLAISRVVTILKSWSGRRMFKEFPELRKELWAGQFWSDSFYVRTVGDEVTATVVRRYIERHGSQDGSSSDNEVSESELDLGL